MRGHRDLRAIAAAAALCAMLALVLPFGMVRLVFAAPLALFLPGYAIASAAFARREVDRARLLVLGFGLSLAVLALGALPLNYAPGGIRAGWWALLLLVVVVGACRSAALNRPPASNGAIAWPRLAPNRTEAGLLATGALAALAAIVVIFIPVSATNAIGYTELWMQPGNGQVVQVGLASREHRAGDYTLEFRAYGRDRPFSVRKLKLGPGEEHVVEVDAPAAGDRPFKVSATLFRLGVTAPYRRAFVWVPGGKSG